VYDRAASRRDVAVMESLLVEDAPDVALGQVRFISAFTDRLRDVVPTPVSPFAGVWRWSLGAGGTP
ncbi:MAG: hypothetical protein JO103_01970, partial [Candidatus Eremiobacteraeota bacterium]|nr:hypothetical protein [Candidatus Eremiobacteraeota bacterium]